MNLADVDGWRCEFGTGATEQLDVAAGQHVLITGQGTVVPSGNYIPFEFCIAWREAGDSTNGMLGYFVEDIGTQVYPVSAHTTELTPPLTAGTYEFGVCVRRTQSGTTLGARRLYGTAMVINAGI
jgi:hypothetical protein